VAVVSAGSVDTGVGVADVAANTSGEATTKVAAHKASAV